METSGSALCHVIDGGTALAGRAVGEDGAGLFSENALELFRLV